MSFRLAASKLNAKLNADRKSKALSCNSSATDSSDSSDSSDSDSDSKAIEKENTEQSSSSSSDSSDCDSDGSSNSSSSSEEIAFTRRFDPRASAAGQKRRKGVHSAQMTKDMLKLKFESDVTYSKKLMDAFRGHVVSGLPQSISGRTQMYFDDFAMCMAPLSMATWEAIKALFDLCAVGHGKDAKATLEDAAMVAIAGFGQQNDKLREAMGLMKRDSHKSRKNGHDDRDKAASLEHDLLGVGGTQNGQGCRGQKTALDVESRVTALTRTNDLRKIQRQAAVAAQFSRAGSFGVGSIRKPSAHKKAETEQGKRKPYFHSVKRPGQKLHDSHPVTVVRMPKTQSDFNDLLVDSGAEAGSSEDADSFFIRPPAIRRKLEPFGTDTSGASSSNSKDSSGGSPSKPKKKARMTITFGAPEEVCFTAMEEIEEEGSSSPEPEPEREDSLDDKEKEKLPEKQDALSSVSFPAAPSTPVAKKKHGIRDITKLLTAPKSKGSPNISPKGKDKEGAEGNRFGVGMDMPDLSDSSSPKAAASAFSGKGHLALNALKKFGAAMEKSQESPKKSQPSPKGVHLDLAQTDSSDQADDDALKWKFSPVQSPSPAAARGASPEYSADKLQNLSELAEAETQRARKRLDLFGGDTFQICLTLKRMREAWAQLIKLAKGVRKKAFQRIAGSKASLTEANLRDNLVKALKLNPLDAERIATMAMAVEGSDEFGYKEFVQVYRFSRPSQCLLDLRTRLVQRFGTASAGIDALERLGLGHGPSTDADFSVDQMEAIMFGFGLVDDDVKAVFLEIDILKKGGPTGFLTLQDIKNTINHAQTLRWLDIVQQRLGGHQAMKDTLEEELARFRVQEEEPLALDGNFKDILVQIGLPKEFTAWTWKTLKDRVGDDMIISVRALIDLLSCLPSENLLVSFAAHDAGGGLRHIEDHSREEIALAAAQELRRKVMATYPDIQTAFDAFEARQPEEGIALEEWEEKMAVFDFENSENWASIFGYMVEWQHMRWNAKKRGEAQPKVTLTVFATFLKNIAQPCFSLHALRQRLQTHFSAAMNKAWTALAGDMTEEVTLARWRQSLLSLGIRVPDSTQLFALLTTSPYNMVGVSGAWVTSGSGRQGNLSSVAALERRPLPKDVFLAAMREHCTKANAKLIDFLKFTAVTKEDYSPASALFEEIWYTRQPVPVDGFVSSVAPLLQNWQNLSETAAVDDARLIFQYLDVNKEGLVAVDDLVESLHTIQGACVASHFVPLARQFHKVTRKEESLESLAARVDAGNLGGALKDVVRQTVKHRQSKFQAAAPRLSLFQNTPSSPSAGAGDAAATAAKLWRGMSGSRSDSKQSPTSPQKGEDSPVSSPTILSSSLLRTSPELGHLGECEDSPFEIATLECSATPDPQVIVEKSLQADKQSDEVVSASVPKSEQSIAGEPKKPSKDSDKVTTPRLPPAVVQHWTKKEDLKETLQSAGWNQKVVPNNGSKLPTIADAQESAVSKSQERPTSKEDSRPQTSVSDGSSRRSLQQLADTAMGLGVVGSSKASPALGIGSTGAGHRKSPTGIPSKDSNAKLPSFSKQNPKMANLGAGTLQLELGVGGATKRK
eukprot:TRINITY_DN33767_c0_g1_i2.p1 TRINITY_DN33767_c0_g1~~TRINITY_DN33767_c0_g1_i2.p1  ORF type:complete len:1719 (-),score=372.11 TRINITY_DN33767_c0_g1_i2:595-5355(-)